MAFLDSIKNALLGRSGSAALARPTTGVLSKKAMFVGVLLVLSLLVMVGMFNLQNQLIQRNGAYAAILSEQQVMLQQVATGALAVASGQTSAFDQLVESRNRFLQIMEKLDQGDESQNLPTLPENFDIEYARLKAAWTQYDRDLSILLDARTRMVEMSDHITRIDESLPQMIVLSEQVLADLVNAAAPRANTAMSGQQLVLMHRIQDDLDQVLHSGVQVEEVLNRLGQDVNQIETNLLVMIQGNPTLGIEKVVETAVVDRLITLADLYSVVKENISGVLDNSALIASVRDSSGQIESLTPAMLAAASSLAGTLSFQGQSAPVYEWIGIASGVAAVVLLLIMIMVINFDSQRTIAESQEQNEKNQRAILRLLDEMTSLADGDLSTHTTVTEDITGAIADSVNYSIDALRDLVGTINNTANQVRVAVRNTQSMTGELAEASDAQARQISTASGAVTEISKSMLKVSERASDSAEVARKSVSIAHSGGETVRQTIQGMETIREQIQETSKRIKRLGESSQEIGDIVNLITEISDQTNILALNAAIQASMAGEAGRGFAVVADEVQRLAERTGDATKQIEALVKTIQADTNEATVSMEQSTANVVKGAKLTENAGGALDRIEQVSMNLAQRILEISDATRDQAQDSVKITETMDAIREVTAKTSRGSVRASNSIGELSSMVQEMQESVAGFKLPDANPGKGG